jgi:hypothetical protein
MALKDTEKNNSKKETKEAIKEASVAAAQVVTPLKVEVRFQTITDLKQAIGFDADGNLTIRIQFESRVDQYEIFRLVNLLKQPHGVLYATIGSPQSAMDFLFTKDGKMEILKAEIAQAKKPAEVTEKAPEKPAPIKDTTKAEDEKSSKIVYFKPDVASPVIFQQTVFNHIAEEGLPFGVSITYDNGKEKGVTVAGRGHSAAEAVIAGVKNVTGFGELQQPFQILEALKKTQETPAQIKLVRTIELGNFFEGDGDTAPKK